LKDYRKLREVFFVRFTEGRSENIKAAAKPLAVFSAAEEISL